MQLWNNRDETEVTTKLTTVSYGGLKEDNGDVTMACLTAIVGDVHLENELIAAGVVYLFNKFILVGSNIFDATSILHLRSIMRVFRNCHTLQTHLPKCLWLVTMTQL